MMLSLQKHLHNLQMFMSMMHLVQHTVHMQQQKVLRNYYQLFLDY